MITRKASKKAVKEWRGLSSNEMWREPEDCVAWRKSVVLPINGLNNLSHERCIVATVPLQNGNRRQISTQKYTKVVIKSRDKQCLHAHTYWQTKTNTLRMIFGFLSTFIFVNAYIRSTDVEGYNYK